MISEVIDVFDDEDLDDPITLIDYEQARINAIKDIADCPTVSTNHTKSSDRKSHDTASTYGKSHFILPVTFFDISSNLRLLNDCRPVAIKIVDCDKHPWYYRKYKMNTTIQEISEQGNIKPDSNGLISTYNKDENKVIATPVGLTVTKQKQCKKNKRSIMNQGKKIGFFECRQDMEKKLALINKNLMKIDYKRNVGLVGLKITPLVGSINSKNMTNKQDGLSKCSKLNEADSYILDVDKALNNVGTVMVPIQDEEDQSYKSKEARKLNQDEIPKNQLKKIKTKERKQKRAKEILLKSQNIRLSVTKKVLATPIEKKSILKPSEPTNKRCNVKDKRKTNKYLNDLLKQKSASEDKISSLVLQLKDDLVNDTASSNVCNSIIEHTVEKRDLSPCIESMMPIDPGIKSPVLPCNKPKLQCGSGQMRPSKVITPEYISKTEKHNFDDISKVNTVTTGDRNMHSTNSDKSASVSKSHNKNNYTSDTVQDASQNSLNDIVISNVISVSNNEVVRDNSIHRNQCVRDSVPIITLGTHKLTPPNNSKTKPQSNVIPLENTFENLHKLPGTSSQGHIIASSETIASGNGTPKHVTQNQKQSPVRNIYQTNLSMPPKYIEIPQNQVQHDPKGKAVNFDIMVDSLHYYNSILPAYPANFIPNNYTYCPDPNKANFEQNPNILGSINMLAQPVVNMNSKTMFWPYWPPPPPPPLPPPPLPSPLPPPPPPPPLQCPEGDPQNKIKIPSKVKLTKVEFITGKNIGNNDSRRYTSALNAGVTINIENYSNTSLRNLSKLPVETTAQPVTSKTEMFEALEKEMMTIHKDISKENSLQKHTNIYNRPKVSEEKLTSDFVRISSKNSNSNVITQIPPSSKCINQKLSNEMYKSPPPSYFYSPKEHKIIKTRVNPKNKLMDKKECFSYLLGRKVSHQHKISPVKLKVGFMSTVKENHAVSSNQIQNKVANEKSEIGTGYSPPILPIPTYENSHEIFYLSNSGARQMQPVFHSDIRDSKCNGTLNIDCNSTSKNKKTCHDNYEMMKLKKISLEQYKERSKSDIQFAGTTDTLPYKRPRKNDVVSKSVKTLYDIINPHSEQDLGYDSDCTIKL